MTYRCPSCGEPVDYTDGFCEACGSRVASPAVSSGGDAGVPECPACEADGSPYAITADGYCDACGRKAPAGRDHVELDVGLAAGVTDRGVRHSRNEDAMALAAPQGPGGGPVTVVVVCDGVSSAPRADEASLTAVRAASRALLAAVRAGDDLEAASAAALQAGRTALGGLAAPSGAPAATYASAVLEDSAVTVCWAGDSRVYWLAADEGGSRCLTKDDSLAEEIVAAGMATVEEAMASPQAHVITRWLGADLPDLEPHVARFEPPGPGVVLVCSDGLWNYRPEAADLAAMALPGAQTDPLAAAIALVKFAVDAGGADNITAVLAPFPPVCSQPLRGDSDDQPARIHRGHRPEPVSSGRRARCQRDRHGDRRRYRRRAATTAGWRRRERGNHHCRLLGVDGLPA
jgi:serine/threonine protein phosphatase PrpC